MIESNRRCKRLAVSLSLLLAATCCCTHSVSINDNLPLGDINVVVITDDHSWVGGHGAHEELNADYGDVLSFYQRLVNATTQDVFLVHNGDWLDGTGLSTYPPTHLEPIMLKMPWDAMTIGNHDIYKSETVEFMTRDGGMVDKLGERFLTSNIVNSTTGDPIGHRYRYLRGKSATVLTFGFMYNLEEGIGSPLVIVERVEEAVTQKWFLKVLRANDFDAILILAHMGADEESIPIILSAIRNETGPKMPVQFITGHMHRRRFDVFDDCSTAVEPGKYLDTVGFVSFPTKHSILQSDDNAVSELFRYELIDAKVQELSSRVGVSKLKTREGQALTNFIHKTQENMGLSKIIGCSPQIYYLNRSLGADDSLFGLWARKVVSTQFLAQDPKRVVLQGTRSSFRYDLFEGNVTMDDLMIVSPFNDSFYVIAENVSTATILEVNATLNQRRLLNYTPVLPNFIVIGDIQVNTSRDLYTLEYEVPFIKEALENIMGVRLQPKPVDAFATSMWQSYVETVWRDCSSYNVVMNGFASELVDERETMNVSELPPSSPGSVALFVATTSALTACALLGRFMLKRLPGRRRTQYS